MISVNAANVTIQYFTFSGGNRGRCSSPNQNFICTTDSGWHDIQIWAPNSSVYNSTFNNSTAWGISVGANQTGNSILSNNFYYGGESPIAVWGSSGWIQNNLIEHTAKAAMNISGSYYNISSNALHSNAWNYVAAGNSSGGQLFVEYNVQQATVKSNTLTFNYSEVPYVSACCWTGGIESHGFNIDVEDNTATGHNGPGIYFQDSRKQQVSGIVLKGNIAKNNLLNGINLTYVSSVTIGRSLSGPNILCSNGPSQNGTYDLAFQPSCSYCQPQPELAPMAVSWSGSQQQVVSSWGLSSLSYENPTYITESGTRILSPSTCY